VPLCGKTLDLKWLASQGHKVIGVELNESACRSFFEENGIDFSVKKQAGFNVYNGDNIIIFNGDVFEIKPEDLNPLGAIYDRAALIALHPDLRTQYAKHITELVRSCAKKETFQMLQIVLERTPHDGAGPPFSITSQELDALYGAPFEIQPLSRESLDMGDPSAKTVECAYAIRMRP
jgi:thiopurine S-methyltransferase